MSYVMYFNAYLTCVFKGHVRDWRQKIQRAKGETGKVGNFDHSSSCFNNKINILATKVNKWPPQQYSFLSLPQRKRTGQGNNKEGRCGAHCKYTEVSYYARFTNLFILTWKWRNTIMSSWQMGEMEIPRSVAERSLREHMGNVVEALIALTNWVDETALRCMDTLDCFIPAHDQPFSHCI